MEGGDFSRMYMYMTVHCCGYHSAHYSQALCSRSAELLHSYSHVTIILLHNITIASNLLWLQAAACLSAPSNTGRGNDSHTEHMMVM